MPPNTPPDAKPNPPPPSSHHPMPAPLPSERHRRKERNIYLVMTLVLQAILCVGLAWYIFRADWQSVFLTAAVIGLTLLPALLRREYKVIIPAEFQLVAVLFVFLSLFMGSAAGFYYRYWWWDLVLHSSSGFLLGMVGFLVIFILNQTDRVPVGVKPIFMCFFAVTFAVFLGVLWEIFEFTVDQIWPHINMQSTETGVVDTMKDLIVDLLGAIVVAVMGYIYTRNGRYSFIADAVRKFIVRNPTLFGREGRAEQDDASDSE